VLSGADGAVRCCPARTWILQYDRIRVQAEWHSITDMWRNAPAAADRNQGPASAGGG
jgi:hypothetical protein